MGFRKQAKLCCRKKHVFPPIASSTNGGRKAKPEELGSRRSQRAKYDATSCRRNTIKRRSPVAE